MLIASHERDEAHREATLRDYAAAVCAAMDLIQQQAPEVPSLDELARQVGFSSYHFHRIFGAVCGETLGAFCRRVRLHWAAQRLLHHGWSVTRAAVECGYATPSAFTRAFQRTFGCAPSELRDEPSSEPATEADGLASAWLAKEAHPMNVEIRDLPETTVAYVRHIGPYDQIGRAWGKLMMSCGMRRLLGPNSRTLGIYYDDPDLTAPDKLRADACVTVAPGTAGKGDVGVMTIAAGAYAVAVHQGPYRDVGPVYDALLRDWLPGSGRSLRDAPCLEWYLNDPRSTPESELLTEVCVPIE